MMQHIDRHVRIQIRGTLKMRSRRPSRVLALSRAFIRRRASRLEDSARCLPALSPSHTRPDSFATLERARQCSHTALEPAPRVTLRARERERQEPSTNSSLSSFALTRPLAQAPWRAPLTYRAALPSSLGASPYDTMGKPPAQRSARARARIAPLSARARARRKHSVELLRIGPF